MVEVRSLNFFMCSQVMSMHSMMSSLHPLCCRPILLYRYANINEPPLPTIPHMHTHVPDEVAMGKAAAIHKALYSKYTHCVHTSCNMHTLGLQVPSILSEELKYNPFMLTDSDILKDALGLPHHTPPAEVLARLRQRKDNFRTN